MPRAYVPGDRKFLQDIYAAYYTVGGRSRLLHIENFAVAEETIPPNLSFFLAHPPSRGNDEKFQIAFQAAPVARNRGFKFFRGVRAPQG